MVIEIPRHFPITAIHSNYFVLDAQHAEPTVRRLEVEFEDILLFPLRRRVVSGNKVRQVPGYVTFFNEGHYGRESVRSSNGFLILGDDLIRSDKTSLSEV